jgi:hydroxymethylpyrimidine/phosphomethylpyrimidine kinase
MQTVFILESLAEEFRVPYLDTMSVVDPVWSAKVRQHLITDDNLESVSDELLRPAVSGMNLDRLSILLAVSSEEFAERILSFRTPREQMRLNQARLSADAIPEAVRRRELADLATLLRQERAHTFDTSSAA